MDSTKQENKTLKGDDSITPSTQESTTAELEKDVETGTSTHKAENQPNGEQAETRPDEEDAGESSNYINGSRLYVLSAAFTMAGIMLAIDGSILSTAIPRITSEFNSIDDIGWYGSAYLLAQMCLQPTFGRAYIYFEAKIMFLLSLLTFEVGSVICAVAPSSLVLILGRAIAGAAAAGMLTGNLAIFGQVVPLRNRPRGMAIMTGLYSIATLAGPTVGGLLTDSRLTWRFCFWINLPFGFIAAVIVIFILHRKPGKLSDLPLKEKIGRLDLASAAILTGSLVCLFLGLQWGGSTDPWSAPRVWGCLIGFAVLCVIFIGLQARRKERATIPLRLLQQRTVAICCIFSGLYGVAIVTHSYLLPIWFQGVKGTDATMSGVYMLPFTGASTIAVLVAGFSMTASGHYVPFMWAGSLVYVAGSALYTTLKTDSNAGRYLGSQVLAGVGFGTAIQVTFIGVQVVTPAIDMPTVCALEVFFRQLGGSVGISVAQSIFLNTLTSHLRSISGINPEAIIHAGVIEGSWSNDLMNPSTITLVKDALNTAITKAFLLPIGATVVAAVISLGMERRQIEDDRVPSPEKGTGASENEGISSGERPAVALTDCQPMKEHILSENEMKGGKEE
ncbi:Aspyridones efflux protein [Penicillium cataractarum]|uniref:Aspyridones efflux protein n=1 Tax=Penicillium cataractarum TaxID=2100454 RepID=A0A9W9RYF2_9EURO|nr:Aspyridones efflux protein [Penicillium cataractarum]KAJ5368692.1 Aspyridones efflux protein [Penicillium cataractarum]